MQEELIVTIQFYCNSILTKAKMMDQLVGL